MGKPKAIKFELIEEGTAPYRLLEKVREQYHEETEDARIALAWKIDTKPDVDGRLVLGKCIRVTDLYKEFAVYDFIITLNRETWDDREFGDACRMALLDHELCHAARRMDNEGEPVIDDRQRPVWRSRKHDIEEFQSVVEHHGCYKRDLQQFAEALKKKRNSPLFGSGETPFHQTSLPTQSETEALKGDTNPPKDAPKKGKSGPKDLAAFHAKQGSTGRAATQ